MNIMYLAAGILLLFLGRKLFWLFVAVVGFLVGLTYISQILPGQTETVILAVSLIAGLLGALLAVLMQKFAVGLAGLAAGGYIAYYLLQTITLNVGEYQWCITWRCVGWFYVRLGTDPSDFGERGSCNYAESPD